MMQMIIIDPAVSFFYFIKDMRKSNSVPMVYLKMFTIGRNRVVCSGSGPGSPFPEACAADCSCEPWDYGESPSGSKELGPTESSKGLMDQEKVIRKYIILLSLYLDVENKVL